MELTLTFSQRPNRNHRLSSFVFLDIEDIHGKSDERHEEGGTGPSEADGGFMFKKIFTFVFMIYTTSFMKLAPRHTTKRSFCFIIFI